MGRHALLARRQAQLHRAGRQGLSHLALLNAAALLDEQQGG
jgi:hypothetical protein